MYNVTADSYVDALKERIVADEEQFKTQKDSLIKSAEERRKGQVMEEFLNYLKARAKVELNPEYLASIAETGRALTGAQHRR